MNCLQKGKKKVPQFAFSCSQPQKNFAIVRRDKKKSGSSEDSLIPLARRGNILKMVFIEW